ncbi:MAG: terminase small subunit [Gloeobacteraceae cyanobacterium ES-bin-316]|nr:terminase small subunit [Ferruginibacter sp.]
MALNKLPLEDDPLGKRHELFAQYYVEKPVASDAAIRAGYPIKSARATGSGLLTYPNIRKRIKSLQAELFAKIGINQERVLGDLVKLAQFDIRELYNEDGSFKLMSELTREQAMMITGIETEELTAGTGNGERITLGFLKKVKFLDRLAAIEKLVKVAGWNAPEKAPVDENGIPVKKQIIRVNGIDIEFE